MNARSLAMAGAACFCAFPFVVSAESDRAYAPARPTPTHAELEGVARAAKDQHADAAGVRQLENTANPAKENKPPDLLATSDILCFNDSATLVPKDAILHIPSAFASRIGMKDGSKFQVWSDFLAANRGWITTVEITPNQAGGNDPISDETSKSISKANTIVVAVYKGGPISLKPYKDPAASAPARKP